MKRNITLIISLAIFTLCIFFLGFTGNIDKGYHLTDDHEILRIEEDLLRPNANVFDVATKWVVEDLKQRYRPVYYLHRVFETSIFGSNFFYWSIWTAILSGLTFSIIYFAFGNNGFNWVDGLTVLLITFIGDQYVIWWKLGPNETIGMFFLACSLYGIFNKKIKWYNDYLYVGGLILASLSKESFTFIIPAFVILKFIISYTNKEYNLNLIWQKVKSELTNSLILACVFIINVYFIIFVVGINKIGYAGLDSNSDIKKNIILILKSFPLFQLEIITLILFTIYFLILIIKKQKIWKLTFFGLFITVFFLPLLITYNKTGMVERYLLPATFGFAITIVLLISEIRNLIKINTNYFIIPQFFLIVAVFFQLFPGLYTNAKSFSQEGFQNQELENTINLLPQSANILLVANPVESYEDSYSISHWFRLKLNREIYVEPINITYKNDFEKLLSEAWLRMFNNKSMTKADAEFQTIIFLRESELKIFENKYLDKINFSSYKYSKLGNKYIILSK